MKISLIKSNKITDNSLPPSNLSEMISKKFSQKNFKIQPVNINPDLFCRFLLKYGYNGSYIKDGVKITMLHTKFGVIQLIN